MSDILIRPAVPADLAAVTGTLRTWRPPRHGVFEFDRWLDSVLLQRAKR